jgi:hypothetical protein
VGLLHLVEEGRELPHALAGQGAGELEGEAQRLVALAGREEEEHGLPEVACEVRRGAPVAEILARERGVEREAEALGREEAVEGRLVAGSAREGLGRPVGVAQGLLRAPVQ